MSNILIVATRYDVGSHYTYQWARALQEEIVKKGHVCFMLDGESFCRAGQTLSEVLDRADYVVFYGHGDPDKWIGLPSFGGANLIPIVDVGSIAILDGRKVYAGCCHSLNNLGPAYVNAFTSAATTPEYVGYSDEFGFEIANNREFRDVVNPSVVAFVGGASAATVAIGLQNDWDALRHEFARGRYSGRPNAIMAAQRAAENSQRIGHR
jgi:hypothetical protein